MKYRWLFFILCNISVLSAKDTLSVYRLHYGIDVPIFTISGALGIGSIFLEKKLTPIRWEEVQSLDANNVNRFDRYAVEQHSDFADKSSDLLLYTSMASPALLFTTKNARDHWKYILPMWVETFALNTSLNLTVKAISGRIRPYVYRQDDDNYGKSARSSFYSGHTSSSSSSTFFLAMVYAQLYPSSRWKPLIWTSAALLPALTGICRVEAGQHYWTDVIAGYAIGASIGSLIPLLHKKIFRNRIPSKIPKSM
jgi:hypothetical protein